MKQMILIALLVLVTGCQSTIHPVYPNWHLVYSHDKDGNPTFGDKNRLLEYAKSGRPIRIVWPIRENFVHSADAGFLTIMNDELFAQTTSISRQIPDRESWRSIALDAKEQSRWHAIFATTGQLQSFQSVDSKLSEHQFSYHWYVFAVVRGSQK